MKQILYILLLMCFGLNAQTGPDATIKGRVFYNYQPTGLNNTKFAALDTNGQLVFQAGRLLNQTQYEQFLSLIYVNNTSTLSVSPTTGERGISTAITLSYSINSGSDIFTSASINQGVGAASWDSGTETVSGGNRSQTTTYTLTKNFTRNGTPTTETQSATYTAFIPQWAGVSTDSDLSNNTYSSISSLLTKYVQNSTTNISYSFTTTGTEYPYFITASANGTIKDSNGFTYTIDATEFSGTGYWYRKSFTLTLNDSSIVTLYMIRAKVIPTANLSAFIFTYFPA